MKAYTTRTAWLVCGLLLLGCSASRPAVDRDVTRGLDATDRFLAASPGQDAGRAPEASAVLARLGGEAVTFADILPAMIESGGAVALEEAVLDRLLVAETRRRGITITAVMIDAERESLARAFADAGAARSSEESARLLARVRAARGLGEQRYAAMLRRNAALRVLIAPEVAVTPAALEQAYAFRFGERYRARLLVTPDASAAEELAQRVRAGESFSVLAAENSIDPSAERGGLLEPVSPADPAYPAAVRSALRTMSPGDVSRPIAVEGGFALLFLDGVISPASPPPAVESVRDSLEASVRAEQERLLMNRLARRLLESADLSIVDRGLDTAWRARTNPP